MSAYKTVPHQTHKNKCALSLVGNVTSFSDYSPDVETRNAYVPLGPRDNFPFVGASRRKLASARPLLFNIEVEKTPASGVPVLYSRVARDVQRYSPRKGTRLIGFMNVPRMYSTKPQLVVYESCI